MPQLDRRAFLVGSASLLGAGALLARTTHGASWAFGGSAEEPRPAAAGVVKIVDFTDDGKRVGVASVAKVVKTEAEWKKQLPEISFQVTRHAYTEAPYSGPLDNFYKPGIYRCICCDTALFSSETKYDAHEGWPSFWAPLAKENVTEHHDTSVGMDRVEIECARCDAHLGHLFDDGPQPTGMRYCMDSAALRFVPRPPAGK